MHFLRSGGLWAALAVLAGVLAGSPAFAQSALCPASIASKVGTQAGISFQGSSCTNGPVGAYSNAALASQSLGELSESSTEEATGAMMGSISDRRTTETQSCPEGFAWVYGVCQSTTSSLPFASQSPPNAVSASKPNALAAIEQMGQAVAQAPAAEPAARMAVWTRTYGDYEWNTGHSPGLGEFSPLALDVTSATTTGGVLGGVDFTVRGVAAAGDGLIFGALAGYEKSQTSINTASVSTNPATPSGFSTMKATLSGPATGIYASYFNGGFSADAAFNVEFLNLNLAFNDLLGYQAVPSSSFPPNGFPPTTSPFGGIGTAEVDDYTTSLNLNYRLPVSANVWTEPTAGVEFTRSIYSSDASQFGLADGCLLQLQTGERLGVEGAWDKMRITTVFTGLLYDNVLVSGNALPNAPNPRILSNQGQLRAGGVLAVNLFRGGGVSYFLQADLEGGKGQFGAGGTLGVRVAW